MRIVDEASRVSRPKLIQLSFEDFLEALVRIATMKALPTDEEIAKRGVADGGHFMLFLQEDRAGYEAFLSSHDPGEGLLQPAERSTDHLCTLLMRRVKGAGGRSRDCTDLTLDQREVAAFINEHVKR